MGNKIKKSPHIRFVGFTDDWQQRKLVEISSSIEYGLNAAAKEFDGKNKYIRITDINDESHNFIVEGVTSPDTDLSTADNYKLSVGDILFARTGASVGKSYIYKDSDGLVYYAGFLIRARIKEDYNPEFVFQNTLTKDYEKYITITSQRSGQPGVNAKEYSEYKMFIPKRPEQDKISSYLRNLDNLIELQQRKVKLLKITKKSMLQKMFPKYGESVPEIRFEGFTDDWEQCELGKVGNTFTGLSGKTKEDFGHGDAKFVTYMNVFGNVISDPKGVESVEIDNKQNQVKYGDVFFTTSSETPEEVGMASVWLENTENVYLNSFCFGYRPTVEFDLYYLAFMLRSPEIRKNFMLLAQGISRYNISKNKVMEMNVPVPELNEQRKIGTFFRTIDSLIANHQHELELLKDFKKTMLQQMFI